MSLDKGPFPTQSERTPRVIPTNNLLLNLKGWVIGLSLALLWFNIAHGTEELIYGFDQNFGLDSIILGKIFAAGYVLQASGILLALGTKRIGYVATLITSALVTITATQHHLHDILTIWPYRAGVISKALEIGLIVGGGALYAVSLWAFIISTARHRSQP